MEHPIIIGVDMGSICVKAVVLKDNQVCGRAVVPVKGYFQDRAREAVKLSCEEARLGDAPHLIVTTGFAGDRVPGMSKTYPSGACLAAGAFEVHKQAMTLLDIGGYSPRLLKVNAEGRQREAQVMRKCAVGISSFLEEAAHRLDVHPTRLQALAAEATGPAAIGSYCSVFANGEIPVSLRNGATLAEVALGCIYSVAERIYEMGDFDDPVLVCGGIPIYYPGVLLKLQELMGLSVQTLPNAITIGAHGAALKAREELESGAMTLDVEQLNTV